MNSDWKKFIGLWFFYKQFLFWLWFQEKVLPTADVSPLFVVAKSEAKISKGGEKGTEQRAEKRTKEDEEMEEGELKEEDNKKENRDQKHSIQRNAEEQVERSWVTMINRNFNVNSFDE